MPSQQTQWYKDVRLIQMLDEMRKRNKTLWSKCYFCDQKSQGIKSIDYRLYAVCPDHDSIKPDKPDINKLMESQTSFEE